MNSLIDFSIFLNMFNQKEPTTLILILITTIFFVAWFYSILKDFTAFSSGVAFVLSLGLAIIVTFFGVVGKIVYFLTKTFGPLITLIVIVLFFTSTYFLEHFISLKIKKSKKLREEYEKMLGEEKLKEIGKMLK